MVCKHTLSMVDGPDFLCTKSQCIEDLNVHKIPPIFVSSFKPFTSLPHQELKLTNIPSLQQMDFNAKREEKMGTAQNRSLIFTYGTLKRGFPNHGLIEDLIPTGDAKFLGVYQTVERFPLVCGPFRVPFLINLRGHGDRVWGELYAVTEKGLERMDELEGTSCGHYERLPIEIFPAEEVADGIEKKVAEAYYAHRSYGEELWRSNEEKGFCMYSEKEASGYVRRPERPQNVSFLEQIQLFCSSSSSSSSPPPPCVTVTE